MNGLSIRAGCVNQPLNQNMSPPAKKSTHAKYTTAIKKHSPTHEIKKTNVREILFDAGTTDLIKPTLQIKKTPASTCDHAAIATYSSHGRRRQPYVDRRHCMFLASVSWTHHVPCGLWSLE